MKTLVVSGNFDNTMSVDGNFYELAQKLEAVHFCDGNLVDLNNWASESFRYNLIIWTAKYDSHCIPRKRTASVLVCYKKMEKGDTDIHAVSEIFRIHANAVIAEYEKKGKPKYDLIDALGNRWCRGVDENELADAVLKLYEWTRRSIRERSVYDRLIHVYDSRGDVNLHYFLQYTRRISERMMHSQVGRYFGSVSTRCNALFPSMRKENVILISSRDCDKRHVQPENMVSAKHDGDTVAYNFIGKPMKPSVDAPIHLEIYRKYPWVEYILHGHAHIAGWPMTQNYYPCGDLREVCEISRIADDTQGLSVMNLKNHGFLILADSLNTLNNLGLDSCHSDYFMLHQSDI